MGNILSPGRSSHKTWHSIIGGLFFRSFEEVTEPTLVARYVWLEPLWSKYLNEMTTWGIFLWNEVRNPPKYDQKTFVWGDQKMGVAKKWINLLLTWMWRRGVVNTSLPLETVLMERFNHHLSCFIPFTTSYNFSVF